MNQDSTGSGSWRAACFLLLALVLVQGDSLPPRQALIGFCERRVVPLSLRIEAEFDRWRPPVRARFERLLDNDVTRFIAELADR